MSEKQLTACVGIPTIT